MYALVNCRIFDGQQLFDQHAVIIEGHGITTLLPTRELSQDIPQIDLAGMTLCPGFIDLQLNGCGGVMLNDEFSHATLTHMHQTNLRSGTTSFLPTLITTNDEMMLQALEVMGNQPAHSQTLGLHLEGPYLSHEKHGIHSTQLIRALDKPALDTLLAHTGVITKITLAPESTTPEQVAMLSDAGILVSLGHSNCSYQQASEFIAAGARFATHLFNAMSSLSGRDPGLVGAVYDHQLACGIIADGLHVADANIRISHRLLGDKLCLVSDATAAAGADIDSFDFVGTTIFVEQGRCVSKDGTLGGSSLTMIEAVKHCVEQVGLPLVDTLQMASLNPAKAIGQDSRLGKIKAGYCANLTAFDSRYKVGLTISDGQIHRFNT